MKDLWNYLKATPKPIVLYGMGNGADLVLRYCEKYGIKVSGVFASDGFVRPKTFHGMPVTDYKTARKMFGDMIVLLCFGTPLPGVIENIRRIAAECELYVPDVPVCGEELFCYDYYKSRKNEFDKIYNLLADQKSKEVFKSIIDFKLSGDIKYLFSCETGADEPFDSFLKLSAGETYLDLGAYRGDTVKSFVSRVKSYNKIVAVEPDRKTYKKLTDETRNIENIQNINAFAGEREGTKEFNMTGSRGAGAPDVKDLVNVITVDSLSLNPTFIKMDIEGAEAAAIAGARDTIKNYKPKIQIAAYHRSGDLADIPAAVLAVRSDYKIYLRHNPCLPAWDTNYFFI